MRQGGITMMAFGPVNHLPRYTTQRKSGLTQTLSWSTGRHTIKTGHDFKFERAENLAPTLFHGQYTFNSMSDFTLRRPASYAQAIAAAGSDGPLTFPDSEAYALFAQDSWRATDRLTLDYGARYDLFSYAGNGVRNPDPGLAAVGLATGVMPRDTNDLAGRFGFVYRPWRERELVVRGGAGTFYGILPGLVARTIQAQNGIQVKTFTLVGDAMPVYPTVLHAVPDRGGAVPDIYVMDENVQTPLTHQWSVSVQGAVGRAASLSMGYRYYWSRNIYLQRAAAMLRPGVVAPHERYCADRDILRSEYYQDFQRQLGLFRVVAGVITRRGSQTLLVTVSRSLNDRPFSREDTAAVKLLLPHFQRAVSIQERLSAVWTPASESTVDPAQQGSAVGLSLTSEAGQRMRLTRAEASMAERLVAGQSIAQICKALNIRETTARTHLRHLFQKTQTRRQAELVARLLRGELGSIAALPLRREVSAVRTSPSPPPVDRKAARAPGCR